MTNISALKTETVFSKLLTQLVHDREMAAEIERVVRRFRDANEEEHKRISEREIRHMIATAICRENPHITQERAIALLDRRMAAAMRPYAGELAPKTKSPTGKDLARAERKATVRRGREGRK
jgi:hypothetical protein